MDAETFDQELQRLGTLAKSEAMLDAFNELYQRLLGSVVTMRFTDLPGVASGLYRVRLAALSAVMHKQMAWYRSAYPRQTAAAEQETKRAVARRQHRGQARWN